MGKSETTNRSKQLQHAKTSKNPSTSAAKKKKQIATKKKVMQTTRAPARGTDKGALKVSAAPAPAPAGGGKKKQAISTSTADILRALRQGLDALGVGLPPAPAPSANAPAAEGRKRPRADEGKGIALPLQQASAHQNQLLCRESQVEAIKTFLLDDHCKTLQLFGMPGTGKTAAVKFAIRDLANDVSAVFVNGYVIQKNADLYQAVYNHLARERLSAAELSKLGGAGGASGGKPLSVPAEHCGQLLEKRFRTGWGNSTSGASAGPSKAQAKAAAATSSSARKRLCVIVIDEMDKCLEKCSKAILKLVDSLTLPHANCKLISIANSMEVSVDAKTRSRLDATLKVVFPPYVMTDLQRILLQRVAHITPKLLTDSAVAFVCRQTASQSGDVRRLLQSTAAAVHDLLCTIEERGSASRGAEDYQQQQDPAVHGIVSVQQVSVVVSKVFQDRFSEYIKEGVQSPLLFLIVCAITGEMGKHEEQQTVALRGGGGGGGPFVNGVLLDRVFSASASLIRHYGQPMGFPTNFTMSRGKFLFQLEYLRQVALVDISCGPEQIPVASVKDVAEWDADSVRVVMLQPVSVVSVLLKLHEKFGKYVSGYFRT